MLLLKRQDCSARLGPASAPPLPDADVQLEKVLVATASEAVAPLGPVPATHTAPPSPVSDAQPVNVDAETVPLSAHTPPPFPDEALVLKEELSMTTADAFMPPPLPPAAVPLKLQPATSAVPAALMAPPSPAAEQAANALNATDALPTLASAPPEPAAEVAPWKVLLATYTAAAPSSAPPSP